MFLIRPALDLDSDERGEALTLLFSDRPTDECRRRIEQGLDALDSGELHPATFLTAWRNGAIAGVLVAEFLSGNSGSLWPIRARPGPERSGIENALHRRALELFQSRKVNFAQSLISSEDDGAREAVLRNGFRKISRIWTMCCDLADSRPSIPRGARGASKGSAASLACAAGSRVDFNPPFGLKMESPVAASLSAFQYLLTATYEGSLDCPELNNLRTPEETIAGHLAGAPDLSRWWIAHVGEEAIGVLILAPGPAPATIDLAYLGVLPSARRQGLGRAILAFALNQSAIADAIGMTLLVDERNRPAIDLYKRFGFHMTDARDLFLQRLRGE